VIVATNGQSNFDKSRLTCGSAVKNAAAISELVMSATVKTNAGDPDCSSAAIAI